MCAAAQNGKSFGKNEKGILRWPFSNWVNIFSLFLMLILLFGALFLLFLGLKINSKIEQQTKILAEMKGERRQRQKSQIIVVTSEKEILEFLGTAINMKMPPKWTQLLNLKWSINGKRSGDSGGKFGQIGAIYTNGGAKRNEICPLMGEEENSRNSNSTAAAPAEDFGVSFWRSVHFQNVLTVVFLATVLLVLFLLGTVNRDHKLATPNDGRTTAAKNGHYDVNSEKKTATMAKGNGKGAFPPSADAFVGIDGGGHIWPKTERQKEQNEFFPLEASVWWEYFSAPTNGQKLKKGAETEVPKPSILKKRSSKKPFETVEIQSAIDPMKSHRFGNSRANKDVHFVARTVADSPKQTNFLDQMGNRISPKESHFELFNESPRLFFILRHPPDENGTTDGPQFVESLEEKMAKRIAAEGGNCWERYSNRGGTNGGDREYRKKATKWVRFLAAIERRRTNKTTPMKTVHVTKQLENHT